MLGAFGAATRGSAWGRPLGRARCLSPGDTIRSFSGLHEVIREAWKPNMETRQVKPGVGVCRMFGGHTVECMTSENQPAYPVHWARHPRLWGCVGPEPGSYGEHCRIHSIASALTLVTTMLHLLSPEHQSAHGTSGTSLRNRSCYGVWSAYTRQSSS